MIMQHYILSFAIIITIHHTIYCLFEPVLDGMTVDGEQEYLMFNRVTYRSSFSTMTHHHAPS